MRIALIGQAAFGEKVLRGAGRRRRGTGRRLHASGRRPAARATRFREAAEARGVPVRQPARMRDPEVFEDYKTFGADLNVMAFVTDIVPLTILESSAAGHHPVPPVAAAPPPGRQRHQLGRHQRRDQDRPLHLLAGRGSRHRPHPPAEGSRPSSPTTPWAPSTSTSCSPWAWRPCSSRSGWSRRARRPRSSRTSPRASTSPSASAW